jgi:hypothetical protein
MLHVSRLFVHLLVNECLLIYTIKNIFELIANDNI